MSGEFNGCVIFELKNCRHSGHKLKQNNILVSDHGPTVVSVNFNQFLKDRRTVEIIISHST